MTSKTCRQQSEEKYLSLVDIEMEGKGRILKLITLCGMPEILHDSHNMDCMGPIR